MTRKKYIYIAHPYRGNPEYNLKEATDICRELYKYNPDVIPISPIHLFSWMDPNEGDMDMFYDLIDFTGNNVTFYGDWLKSEGCRAEAEYFRRQRKKWLDYRLMTIVICLTILYCTWAVSW